MAETKINLIVSTLSEKEMSAQIAERVNHLKAVIDIDCEEVRAFAYETVAKAKKQIKIIETERKKITSVLDEKKKEFMAFEKAMVSEISQETERVVGLVAEYDRLLIEKANKERELYNQQVEAQRAKQVEVEGFFEDTFIEAVATPVLSNPKGTTGLKKFRVVDFDKVPDLFKVLDEVKVREAMKNGIDIAGIEYYIEQKTTFR